MMRDTSADAVLYERRQTNAIVTLNRPEYGNAQNSAMLYAVDDAFQRAIDDDEVRVIVLTGAGKHFSSGHDIGTPGRDVDAEFPRRVALTWTHVGRDGIDARIAREDDVYLGLCRRWREMPKPTIAMVHGACVAGGLMLAWVCDLIVCSEDAFFSDPVVAMGVPGVEFFAHPWVLGPRIAKELLFTGDRMSAVRALEIGMVNRVVPRAELEQETFELCRRIAEMPEFGLALAKRAVNQAEDNMGFRTGIDAAYALHHLGHAHSAQISADHIGGHDAASMKERGR
jgi:enoyl-CoA hydratase